MQRLVGLGIVAAAIGCGGGTAPPAQPAGPPAATTSPEPAAANPPRCKPGFVGHLISEAVDVAAERDRIYWHEYNFGKIESRAIEGGSIELVHDYWDEEHHSEDMALHGEHLYWTSKAENALFRVAKTGGKAEKIASIPGGPSKFVIVGDTAIATTIDGPLMRVLLSTGAVAQVDGVERASAVSASGEQGYVVDDDTIYALRPPYERAEKVLDVGREVTAFLASNTHIYLTARGGADATIFMARELGEEREPWITQFPPTVHPTFAMQGHMAFVSMGNVVLAFDGVEIVPAAIAPADIVDMVATDQGLVVGTMEGSVHSLCPLTKEVKGGDYPGLGEFSCPAGSEKRETKHGGARCVDARGRGVGPSLEYFASGHLKSKRTFDGDVPTETTYYANGTIASRRVGTWDDSHESQYFYANGQKAWDTRRDASGQEVTEKFNLDGSPQE